MNRLTQQQQTVYDYIRNCMISRGFGPTVREIGQYMDIKSPNGVMCHLRALEKKGKIRRAANKSRAIELTEPLPRSDWSLGIQGRVADGHVRLSPADSDRLDLNGLLGEPQQFLLQVQDDSLLAASIISGDYLVIRQSAPTAVGRQLVVVRPVGSEDTLLGWWSSHADQATIEPLAVNASTWPVAECSLLGTVAGVIRRLG